MVYYLSNVNVFIKRFSAMSAAYIIGLLIKLFLLLTPFFILSVFVTTCDGMESKPRRSLALRTGFAVICASVIIYMFGKIIFECLGISLNAFRIGAGLVLMLNGIDMVRSSLPKNRLNDENGSDPAVVPLAIPTTVGPGTIGTLLVMGATVVERAAEVGCSRWIFFSAELGMVIVAGLGICATLYYSDALNRLLKDKGVRILSKLTGMYIVALAAQIIFDGINGFLK
ncbi:MAG: MarC family protein [Lentisphaerae bacterium]|nr:MarC family protein [Lentisphaerota bacterium]